MRENISYKRSALIIEYKEELSELVTNMHFDAHDELKSKYGIRGKEKCKLDSMYHLSYLAEAVRWERSEIFTAYLQWAQDMLQSRNIPVADLAGYLTHLYAAYMQVLPDEDFKAIKDYICDGINKIRSINSPAQTFLKEENTLLPFAQAYLTLLLKGKRQEAQLIIHELLKNGHSIPEIYENIFAPTQYEVGLLWQTNKITVAHEHYCTAATQQIMSALYMQMIHEAKRKLKMVGCSLSGGLHEMGIRMIADLFEMDGWDVYYLGASMPETNIITAVKEQQADILAVSVTMSFDISKVANLIAAIRADDAIQNIKIIVGGYAFNESPGLWEVIGADGWARNAREAVLIGHQMMENTTLRAETMHSEQS